MTSVLFVGDPHFKVSNIQDCEKVILQIEIMIQTKNPDIVVLGGDLLHNHERLHVSPLNLCYKFIKMISSYVHVYILVGNHDYINNKQYLSTHHWMNTLKEWNNVTIIDYPFLYRHNDNSFLFCPYVPNGMFEKALKELESKEGKNYYKHVSCIFAHQEFKGCNMGTFESEHGDLCKSDYPFIVSGHIHKNQMLKQNIYYPGSCMQHTFAENEKNIIAYLEFKQNKIFSRCELPLEISKKITKYVELKDMKLINSESIEKKFKKEDKIRYIITGDKTKLSNFKKTKQCKQLLSCENIKLVFQPKLKESNEHLLQNQQNYDFLHILSSIIDKQNNPSLLKIHQEFCKNKKIFK